MKKFMKLLALGLALVMMFAAGVCAETSAAEKITVGTNAEFAPFEFINDAGEIDGFDAELIRTVMEVLGYECEIVSMDFDALLPALASGKIDLAIAAMTITDERKESALFSDAYFQATQKIIVAEGSTITGEADLAGKKIGVQLGTTGDLYVTDSIADTTVERYTKALDAAMDLAAGRLDAVVVDEAPAAEFVASIAGLTVLEDRLSDEQYGIAANFGSEDLIAQINETLAAMKEEGLYDEIYVKWFGEVETTAATEDETVTADATEAPAEAN